MRNRADLKPVARAEGNSSLCIIRMDNIYTFSGSGKYRRSGPACFRELKYLCFQIDLAPPRRQNTMIVWRQGVMLSGFWLAGGPLKHKQPLKVVPPASLLTYSEV